MASQRAEATPGQAEKYLAIREATRALAAPLSAEDCTVQSMPDASPVKWHLAHTTWFFETFVLEPHCPAYRAFDPAYRVLFNSYYNAIGDKHPRPERGLLSRPGLEEVLAYRQHVDEAMLAWLDVAPLAALPAAVTDLIELGLNHEQQHQELILTDLKHLLSRHPQRPAYQKQWPLTQVLARDARWIPFAEGLREIGHDGRGFCFDNEMPRHRVWLDAYQIASHPVTHGDFIAFIDDGGYRRPELWLSAGWDAVADRGWQAPAYWTQRDGQWHAFTLHGEVPVDPNAPVCHVSFFEADAFARWAKARLPTEAEWEIAVGGVPRSGNFLESGALHPLAPRVAGTDGMLAQAFGDVWEWTRSDYGPYPGFQPAIGAVGEYNGKFMCAQYVLRGGSCATPASHIRATYRNFFPPDARWQFSGLRLARDA
ncbi:ergothioneine biosynthesis protein EgtB [Rhodoferax sp.]|uniref:ergothioneine biosynthesis protein EgtB n=1 Tax=Rhodoferax sp. TaxID=50421 RepID=UPI00271FE627|nr:ergothioneine biosynthesis protein EgtB [Rhodoferax sp.]MDO9197879.1 ergothioneine biosynthesis protein EgtB [Rhodoferax sp.]